MLTTIEVTQGDIDEGIDHDCNECPIALAIKRACPNAKEVDVIGHETWMYGSPGDVLCERFENSLYVRSFIKRFDSGRFVAPFIFHLDIPDQYLKASGK